MGRAVLPLRLRVEFSSTSQLLVVATALAFIGFLLSCLCLCGQVSLSGMSLSSYKSSKHIGFRPNIKTSSSLDYTCKDPLSKQGHIHRFQGLGIQHILKGHNSTDTIRIILKVKKRSVCKSV